MTIQRTYACPGAGPHGPHNFTYLHHPDPIEDPVPRYCPTCGYDSEADSVIPKFEGAVTAPHVRAGRAKALMQAADGGYRGMERASEERAAAAGDITGETESSLKITNMRDNAKYGENSAPPLPASPVTQAMEAAAGHTGFTGAASAGLGALAHQGYAAHAGARAQNMIAQTHLYRHEAMARAGEEGRYVEKKG